MACSTSSHSWYLSWLELVYFFQAGVLLCTENARLRPILAHFSQYWLFCWKFTNFVGVLFTGINSAAVHCSVPKLTNIMTWKEVLKIFTWYKIPILPLYLPLLLFLSFQQHCSNWSHECGPNDLCDYLKSRKRLSKCIRLLLWRHAGDVIFLVFAIWEDISRRLNTSSKPANLKHHGRPTNNQQHFSQHPNPQKFSFV